MKKIYKSIVAFAALAAISQALLGAGKTEPADYGSLAQRFHEEGGVNGGGRDWLAENWMVREDAYSAFNEYFGAWIAENSKYVDSFVSDDWAEFSKVPDREAFLKAMYFLGDFRNMDIDRFDALVASGDITLNARIVLAATGMPVVVKYYAGSDEKGFFAKIVADGFKLEGVKLRPEWQMEALARSADYVRIRELPLDWYNLDEYKIKNMDGDASPANWCVETSYANAMCDIWDAMLNESPDNIGTVCTQIAQLRRALSKKGVSKDSQGYMRINDVYTSALQELRDRKLLSE